MKSKKAEEYLNRIYKPGNKSTKDKAYSRENANKAVEIAEQEMIEKVIEITRDCCPHRVTRDLKMDGTIYAECRFEKPMRPCFDGCQYVKHFIDGLG